MRPVFPNWTSAENGTKEWAWEFILNMEFHKRIFNFCALIPLHLNRWVQITRYKSKWDHVCNNSSPHARLKSQPCEFLTILLWVLIHLLVLTWSLKQYANANTCSVCGCWFIWTSDVIRAHAWGTILPIIVGVSNCKCCQLRVLIFWPADLMPFRGLRLGWTPRPLTMRFWLLLGFCSTQTSTSWSQIFPFMKRCSFTSRHKGTVFSEFAFRINLVINARAANASSQ